MEHYQKTCDEKRGIARLMFVYLAVLFFMVKGCSREKSDISPAHEQSRESVHTNFASEIVLDSYANREVDGHTFMTLTWHAPYGKPRNAYWAFIHAIDKKGNVLFQFDHKLVNADGLPTNMWGREFVKDVFKLTPPADHSPGKYTLRIGVWLPETEKWLSLFATRLIEDQHGFFNHKAVLLPDIDCL